MFKWLGSLLDSNEKVIKRLQPRVDEINEFEPEFEKLTDAELRAKTDEFKTRLKEGAVAGGSVVVVFGPERLLITDPAT